MEGYVKHNQFDRKQHKTTRDKSPISAEKFVCNKQGDYYICPMGQCMEAVSIGKKNNFHRLRSAIKKYRAKNCEGCPLRGMCHKSQGNRVIEVNHNLNRLKAKAEDILTTPTGIEKRKRRCFDLEPVFANIKNNLGFKWFMQRGIHKVTGETGLLALAHNLRKKVA